MADKTTTGAIDQQDIPVKWVDQGDGTWALRNTSSFTAPTSTTATLSNVAGSASSVTLQALNTSRKGLVIVNDSTSVLYVKHGSTASATSFTYYLPGSVAGSPYTLEIPTSVVYTGIVTGIWVSATGTARVTELT